MDKYYFPDYLAEECQRVKEMFPEKAPIVEPGEMDDLLKHLILTLVALKPSQVIQFGKERSEEEISSLAGYVCSNSLRVKCDNIYSLLDEYASPSDWKTIFGDWQNYLNNQEAASFLKNGVDNNLRFQTYLSDKGIEKTDLSWINQKDKVKAICDTCKNADTIEDYRKSLFKTGLIDGTLLMKTCRAKFFLNCSVQAYKSIEKDEIYDAFIKLSSEEKADLAVNFVRVFTLQELPNYVKMYGAFEKEKERYKKLFTERFQSADLMEKYIRWSNRMMIKETIGIDNSDPYRTAFWLEYEGNAIKTEVVLFSNRKDKVLVMTFDNYVVTEFGGKAEGRAYIFTGELFEKYKRRINRQSRNDFKNEVNNDLRVLEKMAHQPGNGGWRFEFRYILKEYGILPSEN